MKKMALLLALGTSLLVGACDGQLAELGTEEAALTLKTREPLPPTRPGGLTAKDPGPAQLVCDEIMGVGSWCSCDGENSAECDLLFEACDVSGGQWECSSDQGGDDDVCVCMD